MRLFLQTLALFGALQYGSLFLVLSWITLVPQLVRSIVQLQLECQPLQTGQLLSFGLGAGSAVLFALTGFRPGVMTTLCLSAWTLADCLLLLWAHSAVVNKLGVRTYARLPILLFCERPALAAACCRKACCHADLHRLEGVF